MAQNRQYRPTLFVNTPPARWPSEASSRRVARPSRRARTACPAAGASGHHRREPLVIVVTATARRRSGKPVDGAAASAAATASRRVTEIRCSDVQSAWSGRSRPQGGSQSNSGVARSYDYAAFLQFHLEPTANLTVT